jgi:hypothetical protein
LKEIDRSAAQAAIHFSSNSLNPNASCALVGRYARFEIGNYSRATPWAVSFAIGGVQRSVGGSACFSDPTPSRRSSFLLTGVAKTHTREMRFVFYAT